MPVPTQIMTAERFDALPEEEIRKWELLDGELIEAPSATPKHNMILMTLSALLHTYAVRRKLGVVLPETDLAVGANTRLRPEFGFFSAAKWHSIDVDQVPVVETPDVAVEIISPSETGTTIDRKLDAYLKWGVQEAWLIYPETRTLFVHTSAGAQRLSEGAFLTSELIPGFRVQIADLFANL
jgi:Uma2 family endonuclease